MHIIRIGAVTAALAATLGCQSVITGNEGNFRFSYDADDRVFDFNKPIAVGAFLDLRVTDVGDDGPIALTEATSDDDAVLEVTAFESNRLTVNGTGDGETVIRVKGSRDGGEELSDSVNLMARVPDVHEMRHTCGGDGPTAYLTASTAYVPFEFQRTNGQPVIGYGYYPVSISDPGTTLDETFMSQAYMKLSLGGPGVVTLTSAIDESTLALDLITADEITGARQPIAFVIEDIDVGDRNPFFVHPRAGDRTVCQADLSYAVASLTPDLCAVRAINPFAAPGSDQGKEFGWFEIEGVAAGTCRYTVAFPAGNGGAGTLDEFEYPIQP